MDKMASTRETYAPGNETGYSFAKMGRFFADAF